MPENGVQLHYLVEDLKCKTANSHSMANWSERKNLEEALLLRMNWRNVPRYQRTSFNRNKRRNFYLFSAVKESGGGGGGGDYLAMPMLFHVPLMLLSPKDFFFFFRNYW